MLVDAEPAAGERGCGCGCGCRCGASVGVGGSDADSGTEASRAAATVVRRRTMRAGAVCVTHRVQPTARAECTNKNRNKK